jgi:type VI secretion system secreted protein Hcp
MILLNFDSKIKGDSVQKDHDNWINLHSIGHSVARVITTSGAGKDRETSTPSFSEISCTKATDIASNDLFAQAIYGKKICDKANVHFLQTGGEGATQVYMELDLHEPIVSGYTVSSGGDRPTESFTISFTKIVQKYSQFDAGGAVTQADPKGYDLKTGEPFNG